MTLMSDFKGHSQVDVDAPEFSLGSVYGYRGWKLDRLGRLTGVSFAYTFRPGVNRARCEKSYATSYIDEMDEHNMLGCSCGFYAYFSDSAANADVYPVMGVIRGTGQTVIGQLGFRAACAELVAAYVPGWKYANRFYRFMRWFLPKNTTFTDRNRYDTTQRELHPGWGLLMGVLIVGGLGSGIPGIFVYPPMAAVALPLALFGLYLLVDVITANQLWRRGKTQSRKSKLQPPIAVDALREFYPDVPVFTSRRQLFKAFPLSTAQQFESARRRFAVTPETNPHFWEL